MMLSLDPDICHSPTQKISHEPFPVFSCFFNKLHNLTISFSCSPHLTLQGYSESPYPFSLLFPQKPYASPSIHISPYPVPKRYNAKKRPEPCKRVPAL